MRSHLSVAALLGLFCFTGTARAQDLDEALEKATKASAAKVAPSLVQIRTIGGLSVIPCGKGPQVLKGEGPTTGVIVSADGYIISSSFNFADKPAAITVSLPDAKDPLAARVVATDHTRMLTLLKIDAKNLPVPAAVPKSEIKVGQWAIALGKTWSDGGSGHPSVSVGVISAQNRIWGKALQTDAKISPVNYGGALVDMQGRVYGILVPLSPRGEGETAGVDWYDSGIGFAIPLEDVNRVLPKLKEGKDLTKGVLGVNLQSQDMYGAKPVVKDVPVETAAAKAGIKSGDEIVEVDGAKVRNYAQILHALGNKYEGDTVSLKVLRAGKEEEFKNIQLGGSTTVYTHPFLGILPMRDDPDPGVEVRYVYPKSPADTAGVKAGDRIMKFQTTNITGGRNQLLQLLNSTPNGTEIKIDVKKKGAEKADTLTLRLVAMTDAVPDTLPPGSNKKALEKPKTPMGMRPPMGAPPAPPAAPDDKKDEKKDPPKTGFFTQKDEVTGREYWIYVPEDYDPNISYALLVWLHPIGNAMDQQMLAIWKGKDENLCKKHHIILMGPKAENPTGWLTSEADAVKDNIREVMGQYTIDRQKVVAHGLGNGGNLAFYLGFDARDLVRGVASVGGVLQSQAKDNVSNQRLAFYIYAGGRDPIIEVIRATRKKLDDKKFPLSFRESANHGNGYIDDADAIRELARWIDALDRL